jgi:putative DNA primase/helicase
LDLAVEAAEHFNATHLGFTAAVYRGRGAPDPIIEGKLMCQDMERVYAARKALLDVDRSCCKSSDAICPFYDQCGFQRQKKQRADLWFLAHEYLFSQKPRTVGVPAVLIVDEAVWKAGLFGTDDEWVVLSPLELIENLKFSVDEEKVWKFSKTTGAESFRNYRRNLHNAIKTLPYGPIRREDLGNVGLQLNWGGMREWEWERKVEPEVRPDMTSEQRGEALKEAGGNQVIDLVTRVLRALEDLSADGGPAASGRISVEKGKNGEEKVLRIKGTKPVRAGWRVPTLLLDATLEPDLVRIHWPDLVVTADVKVAAAHQRVRQAADATYSLSSLRPRDATKPEPVGNELERQKTRDRKRRDLHALFAAVGRQNAPERVLAVCQQSVEAALGPPLPSNIDLRHHNALAGRDEWRQVPMLAVAGRTIPSPKDAEDVAEALSGRAIEKRIKGRDWYHPIIVQREMADGSFVPAVAHQHHDLIAEAVRRSSCESEIVQIVGRGRGVNRREGDPLDVLVLGDVVLPLPVTELITSDALEPTAMDLMLAAGGVAFENSRHAVKAYPRLWPSANAAKQAIAKGGGPKSLVIKKGSARCVLEKYAHLFWLYQLVGSGQKAARAWVDPGMIEDPAARLEELLGPLRFARPEDSRIA